MDEYSKSSPKTARAIQLGKVKEMERQMSRLLAIGDEQLLVDTLKSDYALSRDDLPSVRQLNPRRTTRYRNANDTSWAT
jgi:hypothetical protein